MNPFTAVSGTASAIAVYPSHYINGQWVKAQSAECLLVHDSSTEAVMATVPAGTTAEADMAVMAARARLLNPGPLCRSKRVLRIWTRWLLASRRVPMSWPWRLRGK